MAIKIKISDLLGKYKMTQKELSDRTGIRPATINQYYHETIRKIDINHISALCKAFKCQVGDIFEYIPDPQLSTFDLNSDEKNKVEE